MMVTITCQLTNGVTFGHHFAAIAGAGPLVGPVIAAQFGYLPGALWILIGSVLAGAVHDMVILFASVRYDGKFHRGYCPRRNSVNLLVSVLCLLHCSY